MLEYKLDSFLNKSTDSLIIIFVKNMIKGKVKSRLAQDTGDDIALKVYHELLLHTQKITLDLPVEKAVYYSDFIEISDQWPDIAYQKFIQKGNNLGERMYNAFKESFEKGYKKIIIIGSDCLELEQEIIAQAFDALNENSFVIGPSEDGGYYLLGMKKLWPGIFEAKSWSTDELLKETMLEIGKLNQSFSFLPSLSDIDNINDLKRTYLFEKFYAGKN